MRNGEGREKLWEKEGRRSEEKWEEMEGNEEMRGGCFCDVCL